jgi:type I restriction enzyme S subunit
MVLEAKPGKIIPDFLPFFMQTSEFMKRAVEISEGSLSPTIKWGKLSTQIFTIPTIERQEKLIPLLLSTMKQEKLLASTFDISIRLLRSFKLTKFKNFFDVEKQRRVNLPDGWKALKLAELIRSAPESGLSPNPVDNNVDQFVLNLNCLTRDGFCPNGFKGIKPVDFSDELKLADGDLLVSRSNTPDLVGLAGLYFDLQGRKAIFPDTMWRIDVNEKKISKEYLLNYLLSPYARRELQRIAAGTSGSMKKINKSSFCKIPVPVPPAEEQAAINETIGDFSAVIEIISKKILEIRALRNSLIKTPGLEGF